MSREMTTIQQCKDALVRHGGFVTHAAHSLGITHGALSTRIKRHKELQQVREEICESYLDLAESSLIAKMKEKDLGSICFYLKCKGKSRGYVERQEINQHTTGAIATVTFPASNLSGEQLDQIINSSKE